MLNDACISTTVPLIDIQSAEFARQYELGIWWSMYGDEQGQGPVPASYLVTNLQRYVVESNEPRPCVFTHGILLGRTERIKGRRRGVETWRRRLRE